jgi:assimilatory nitrate reductase catalytic subunit
VLNTGRIRDQWHTMTRTGCSAKLAEHLPEPFVDLHAQDALLAGVREGELARLTTSWGSMVARVRLSGEMARGAAFAPIHWSGVSASEARVGALVSAAVDPLSGEPEFKHTPVRVEPFIVDWHGVIFTRRVLEGPTFAWWTLIRGTRALRYEFAGRGTPADWASWARPLLGASDPESDFLEYGDIAVGSYRAAYLIEDRLIAYVCVSRRPELPSRAWIAHLFEREQLGDADRSGLLAGRPLGRLKDPGRVVCSCFGVGRNTLAEAIAQEGLSDVQQLGLRLKVGTNCGSCLPELRGLLHAVAESD